MEHIELVEKSEWQRQVDLDKLETVVLVSGCFDILHAGHLAYLKEAKSYGTYLVAAITADKFVNKGPGRPYFDQNTRAEMLRALSIVDHVEIIDHPTALPAIEKYSPNFYVKGPDYKDPKMDATGEIVNEVALVEKLGGQVVYTTSPMYSSSTLVNKFFAQRTDEQKEIIEQVREAGGMDKIKQIMHDISLLKAYVIGEPIIDTYRFVEPQNISSKYPCISAKFLNEENYQGGSTAILNHIKTFCKISHPRYYGKFPRKIRYISQDKQQRIFEVTEIDENIACEIKNEEQDVTVLADFGHGLFSESLLEGLSTWNGFVALNVQTNSSNYGFNTFKKHKRWDYLVLDKRELQLAYHDNKTNVLELAEDTAIIERKKVSVTLGAGGANYFPHPVPEGFPEYYSPAFADQVIDATGAGDAYFAITSLLVKVNAPPIMIPFIGNVFAGLKTKIIGNKSAVSKVQLMKALEALLK